MDLLRDALSDAPSGLSRRAVTALVVVAVVLLIVVLVQNWDALTGSGMTGAYGSSQRFSGNLRSDGSGTPTQGNTFVDPQHGLNEGSEYLNEGMLATRDAPNYWSISQELDVAQQDAVRQPVVGITTTAPTEDALVGQLHSGAELAA